MKSLLTRWRRRQFMASCSFCVRSMPWLAERSRITWLQPAK